MKTAVVHARIEPRVKRQAETVLRKVGLSSSEAINVYFRQIIAAQGLPFPVRIPNAETRKALRDIREGRNVVTAKNAGDFFESVGLK